MNKQEPVSRIIFFSIIAQFINLTGIFLIGDILHLPLFMDTIGTVFIVFYAGLLPGLITAHEPVKTCSEAECFHNKPPAMRVVGKSL